MPLTVTQIKNAAPRPRDYKLSDERGLYVLVRSNGSKLFNFKYRFAGREKKLSFGAFPEVSLQLARKRRDEARRQLDEGVDPGEHARLKKLADKVTYDNSFGAIAQEYINKRRRDGIRETTAVKSEWLLSKVAPSLGKRPISLIKPLELLAVLKAIEDEGQRETARRLRSFVSRVMRYAISTARAEHDHAASLKGALSAPNVKHFAAITDKAQFGELLRKIDSYQGYPSTLMALKLMPHLFPRPGELRFMLWSEINLEGARWTIPASKTKMRREHIVPLSRQVVSLLTEQRKLSGDGALVLPAFHSNRVPISENTINQALRRLGFGGVATAHGFRSTASTLLNESEKWSYDVIERALAHKERDQIRAIYNRTTYLNERVALMQWWSDELDRLRLQGG